MTRTKIIRTIIQASTLALVTLLSAIPARAQQATDIGPTSVFYVNGVNTTLDAAQADLIELNNAWNELAEARGLRFNLAYNPTDEGITDLIEAGNQSGIPTSRVLAMVSNVAVWSSDLLEIYLDLIETSIAQLPITAQVVDRHVTAYRERLSQPNLAFKGQKVIIVSHSQGNLFVNDALAKMSAGEISCIWNVGVATPDHRLASKAVYSTLENDRVIQAARAGRQRFGGLTTLPALSPHDAANQPGLVNSGAHEFVAAYLARQTRVRTEILDNIRAARRAERPSNGPCSERGPNDPETPGPPWTFVLREFSNETYARTACTFAIDDCQGYDGSDQLRTAQNGVSGLTAFAGSNFSEVSSTVNTSATRIFGKINSRHVVISRPATGPNGIKFYTYNTARSKVLARWTINAIGLNEEGKVINTFNFFFKGKSISRLVTSPDPLEQPDNTDDPNPFVRLCSFPRLHFVNMETGASAITELGDIGGEFSGGHYLTAGQWVASLVAEAGQLTLNSGTMDDNLYPERSISCMQEATYELSITH